MGELQTREKTVRIWKNEGETPLEALYRFRKENPLYKDAVLSYAGRLDPMAEGLLLILVDEENKKRSEYLGYDKTYEVEILFGIGTDTGDILGKVQRAPLHQNLGAMVPFADVLPSFVGSFRQKYPIYSSRPVKGKPLFQWAREGKLDEIEIPEKRAEIYSIDFLGEQALTGKEIRELVEERISKVNGDFRQKEILESWRAFLKEEQEMSFLIIKIRVSCSSGTYMRGLAERIGAQMKVQSLAWRITRVELFQRDL